MGNITHVKGLCNSGATYNGWGVVAGGPQGGLLSPPGLRARRPADPLAPGGEGGGVPGGATSPTRGRGASAERLARGWGEPSGAVIRPKIGRSDPGRVAERSELPPNRNG